MSSFETVFGGMPKVTAQAPGRVNLLGEHTDYNDGYVLPIAIEQKTSVSMGRNNRGEYALCSHELDRMVHFTLAEPPVEHFAAYVYGCLMEARASGIETGPLDIYVESDVPMGVGLSSSAALEVATLRALRALTGSSLDDLRIAQLAQHAEIEYAGVRCGIMDQMASSLAGTKSALFLDTRTLERRLVPLPPASAVLVLDSGVARTLAGSGYNQRRAECEEAALRLGVTSLRDVHDISKADTLPEPLRRRVRHVVSENVRVLRAASWASAKEFGALMNASHASLRDDYEVSIPELDRLVALLQAHPDVYGARLTGAGFGGACVALCKPDTLQPVARTVLRDYAGAGFNGRMLVPPSDGAWVG
ncbi:galactokinase [Nitrosovibrio tenuis]|uniref:Galactokinase n=1 Tax=Nitrosovibrio tenuis TaxID=1233 RepID=A0A1H7MTU3_9PROT|nr:galactokinase [Nitrosovibrio tenuis]SEL14095.1 galactokinase [Nitrosovibrio tenuis]